MGKISVVYWTQSGNTQMMAEAVAAGIAEAGGEAQLLFVSEADVSALSGEKAFALGCPAMGAETLEETEFEPFMEALEGSLSGKSVALFGSYGWGDGQWMRDWEARIMSAGGTVVNGEGIVCRDMPGEEALEACRRLGRTLAQAA